MLFDTQRSPRARYVLQVPIELQGQLKNGEIRGASSNESQVLTLACCRAAGTDCDRPDKVMIQGNVRIKISSTIEALHAVRQRHVQIRFGCKQCKAQWAEAIQSAENLFEALGLSPESVVVSDLLCIFEGEYAAGVATIFLQSVQCIHTT